MDIERLIADETARERALYEHVKSAEREMEPYKRRYEALRSEWSDAYNRIKTLNQMRTLLAEHATETRADTAVLAEDRHELAAREASAGDWPSDDTTAKVGKACESLAKIVTREPRTE